MKEIGGYFELELQDKGEFHKDLWAVNLARNGFEFIILEKKYSKVFLPYFTCDVLLEVLLKNKINYQLYNIDENFEPIFDFNELKNGNVFLYTNYFGLKDNYIKKIVEKTDKLIIDNAQSFFSKPIEGIDTFYSARKFFGVSDGAYLTLNGFKKKELEFDYSLDRSRYLFERIEKSASYGYEEYIDSEKKMSTEPLKKMSKLSNKILSSINYDAVAKKRISNFEYLDNNLNSKNKLKIHKSKKQVPLVYPFWFSKKIKQRLIENKIYCPTYWPNVIESCESSSLEYQMANEIVFLPIDQRYSVKEMQYMLNLINQII